MEALLSYLQRSSKTLTVYNYTRDEETLDLLRSALTGYGVVLRTDETELGTPTNVCLLHSDDELRGTVALDDLVSAFEVESAFTDGDGGRPDIVEQLASDVSVFPGADRRELLIISREFEHSVWIQGTGTLYAGFQDLSQLATSADTLRIYERLGDSDVDVTVIGYPDVTLDDPSFTVCADERRALDEYWFLLYDSGDDRPKLALVAEAQRPDLFHSFWTTNPECVSDLFDLAVTEHPQYFDRPA
jgi:DICT domain-containing protein